MQEVRLVLEYFDPKAGRSKFFGFFFALLLGIGLATYLPLDPATFFFKRSFTRIGAFLWMFLLAVAIVADYLAWRRSRLTLSDTSRELGEAPEMRHPTETKSVYEQHGEGS